LKIPGCIARAFVVAYPVSRATETSFLSADPLWQSISHLVVKWVLGAAKSHD